MWAQHNSIEDKCGEKGQHLDLKTLVGFRRKAPRDPGKSLLSEQKATSSPAVNTIKSKDRALKLTLYSLQKISTQEGKVLYNFIIRSMNFLKFHLSELFFIAQLSFVRVSSSFSQDKRSLSWAHLVAVYP